MDTAIDASAAYAACAARDTRWDGRVYLGVTSTGVYCRPSCPARMPRPENCRFFRTAATAAAAGFRACRRCRPDTVGGRRELDASPALADRALRMIADGVVDTSGVPGLAGRLAVSERHLHRVLVAELGTTALRLARTRRAQTARTLLEQTDLPIADVAFAAGFASLRQFNDVVRAELGAAPREVRTAAPRHLRALAATAARAPHGGAELTLRLRVRPPFDGHRLAESIALHAIAGVETAHTSPSVRLGTRTSPRMRSGTGTSPSARLASRTSPSVRFGTRTSSSVRSGSDSDPAGAFTAGPSDAVAAPPIALATFSMGGGEALVEVELPRIDAPAPDGPWSGDGTHVTLRVTVTRLEDLPTAVARVRRWLDLDADPAAIAAHLAADPGLAPLVGARPGLRVLGSLDPFRTLVATILGQQVSLAAARTFTGRLVAALGSPGGWPTADVAWAGERATHDGAARNGTTHDGNLRGATAVEGAPDVDAMNAGATNEGTTLIPALDEATAHEATTLVATTPASTRAAALLFPSAERLAAAGPDAIREAVRIPGARARTVHAAAELVAGGLDLMPGADRDATRRALLAVPGIGPWTLDLLALRGQGDPDALPAGDLVLRRALAGAGPPPRPADVVRRAEAWRPWRAYATTHLWTENLESRS